MKHKRRKPRRRIVSLSSVSQQRSSIQRVSSERIRKLPMKTRATDPLLRLRCTLGVCIAMGILVQIFVNLYESFATGQVSLPLDNALLLEMIKFILSAR